jgi:hypothetical protein
MRKKSNHTVVIIRHASAALDEREGASAYFAMCLCSGLDEDEVGTDSEREQRTQKNLTRGIQCVRQLLRATTLKFRDSVAAERRTFAIAPMSRRCNGCNERLI